MKNTYTRFLKVGGAVEEKFFQKIFLPRETA